MSKAEILAELTKLSPADRQEILQRLWDLEGLALLRGSEPSAEEKALLDKALAEYQRDAEAGRPWREVLSRLLQTPHPLYLSRDLCGRARVPSRAGR